MAKSGHSGQNGQCPLLGVKRTFLAASPPALRYIRTTLKNTVRTSHGWKFVTQGRSSRHLIVVKCIDRQFEPPTHAPPTDADRMIELHQCEAKNSNEPNIADWQSTNFRRRANRVAVQGVDHGHASGESGTSKLRIGEIPDARMHALATKLGRDPCESIPNIRRR